MTPTENLALLKAYKEAHGLNTSEFVRDLLADLMHICDHFDQDFHDQLRIATDNYHDELSPD